MRRTYKLLTLIAVPALVALSACSSSGTGTANTTATPSPGSSAAGSLGADADVAVSGQFGYAPAVTIPSGKASPNLAVRTLIVGNGPTLTTSGAFVGNYVLYLWDGAKNTLVANTYTGNPQEFVSSQLLPGLTTALIGRTVGSRVLAIVPPADAYGSSGDPGLGLSASDTLVFVIDIVKSFAGDASVSGTQTQAGTGLPTVSTGSLPQITIPSNSPPSTLVAKTLITGTGAVVKSGQFIIAQYTAVNWRTGKVFDSSWTRKTPLGVELGANPAQVITGWNALEGQTVGSRVLLVIPPADGYGKAGESKAGIKGTDTLVFVVDILAAYK
jgi:FKBP-type peptidyl-prolyl cis-trans isomerase